jgi:hypothetical protein
MSAIEKMGRGIPVTWQAIERELLAESRSDDEHSIEDDLAIIYEDLVNDGDLYPCGMDSKGRALWRARDYSTIEERIRGFIALRRLSAEDNNVRIQGGNPPRG